MRFLILLFCLLPLSANALDTLWVGSGDNDCQASDPEGQLVSSIPTKDTIEFIVESVGGGTNYFFMSLADGLDNADWETGSFTIKLNCIYAALNTSDWAVTVKRYDDECALEGSSNESNTITNITTGEKEWSITSKNWSAGTSTDRMSLWINADGIGLFDDPDTVRFEVGVANSIVITAVTDGWKRTLNYVQVVDTIWGSDFRDATLIGHGSLSEPAPSEGKLANTGTNQGVGATGYIGAGYNLQYGPWEYVMRWQNISADGGYDSLMVELHCPVKQANADTLFILALDGTDNQSSGGCPAWTEGGDAIAHPYGDGNGAGATWSHEHTDTMDTPSSACGVSVQDTTYGWTPLTTIIDTVVVADTGTIRFDIKDLITFSDTAGGDCINGLLAGIMIRGQVGDSTLFDFFSSEYAADTTIRPRLIRYCQQSVIEIGKTIPNIGKVDTLIIGDTTTMDVNVNIRRWHYYSDDSAFFKLNLNAYSTYLKSINDSTVGVATSDSIIQVQYRENDTSTSELLIILSETPPGGLHQFPFTIESSNLTFYKQPSTEDVLDSIILEVDSSADTAGMNFADSNMMGAYCVYHDTRRHNLGTIAGLDTTWQNFGTGKAFHITRPFISNVSGGEDKLWCDIDITGSVLTITVDSLYLDTSTVWPKVIDPQFGYTADPSAAQLTITQWRLYCMMSEDYMYKESFNSDVTLLEFYCYNNFKAQYDCSLRVQIFERDGTLPDAADDLIASGDHDEITWGNGINQAAWAQCPVTATLTGGVNYQLVMQPWEEDTYRFRYVFDVGTGQHMIAENSPFDTEWNTSTDLGEETWPAGGTATMYGMRATYTESEPGGGYTTGRRRMLLIGEYRRLNDEENIPLAYGRIGNMLHR